MPECYFFFSYARANRENSFCERPDGSRYSLVDQFFMDLCARVSDLTGTKREDVGYQDLSKLEVSDPWPEKLIDALQSSRVLIALISPHYLRSINCGREFGVFMKRYQLIKTISQQAGPKRIVPIFWINSTDCWRCATNVAKQFLEETQFTELSFPDDYPAIGVYQQLTVGPSKAYAQICQAFARRIKSLAEFDPELPRLTEITDFRQLPSAFDPSSHHDEAPEVVAAKAAAPVHDIRDLIPAGGCQPSSFTPPVL
jgi:hypothetical protein